MKQQPNNNAVLNKGNPNKVLIVLSVDEDEDLRANLLPKIMKAIDVDIANETIVLYAQRFGINIMPLFSDQEIDKVIVFGVSPANLSLNISGALYAINKINSVEFLFSADLKTIATRQDHKKALWANLQILFLNEGHK